MQDQDSYKAEDYFILFREGDAQGFNYFFHQLYKPLIHFAFTFLKNRQAAEDIVEDSFLRLWEQRQILQSSSSVKPFLFAVVRNRCIDLKRKEKHQTAYVAYLKKGGDEIAADLMHKIIVSESMHQIYTAIQNLPIKYKRIFNLVYVQGKEIKEIAFELNLPLSTVKSQKARVLELLKKQLSHLGCFVLLLLIKAS